MNEQQHADDGVVAEKFRRQVPHAARTCRSEDRCLLLRRIIVESLPIGDEVLRWADEEWRLWLASRRL